MYSQPVRQDAASEATKPPAAIQHNFVFENDTNPNSSMVASQESSLTAQGLITYNKTILVKPDEIIFNQVAVNQAYQQIMTLQNTLSAPVEIALKNSSQERLDLAPKQLRLQPHETCQVTVSFRQPRPFPAKTMRQKETIFIKSDFFDQKVAVMIFPATQTGSSDASSLQRAPAKGVQHQQAFQQATSTMSRQQLATTTIGKTSGFSKSPKQNQPGEALSQFEEFGGGQNDSFGRATTSDFQKGDSSAKANMRRQEFSPSVQASGHVEVTLAADSKADIVSASGLGYLASDTSDRNQAHMQGQIGGVQRQFESHETALLKQQLTEIREQNKALRAELAEARQKSQQDASNISSQENDHLDQIKALLREREPKLEELLAEAIKVERAGQKRKDQKILEILQFKDQQIGELTQAMADHKVVKQVVQDQTMKLQEAEQQLKEAQSRLAQYEGSEDRFQELLLSQNKITEQSRSINDLQVEITSLKNEVGSARQTKAFYEESIERAKTQSTLLQGKLDACQIDLNEERDRNQRLGDQVHSLETKLDKISQTQNGGDPAEKLQSLEVENSHMKEKIFRMQDQLSQVFHTLGKVTGESTGHGLECSDDNSKASTFENVMSKSVFGGSSPHLAQSSGFDEQLQQRAEEIVLIVEQVQTQYTILEKEMRSLLDKGPSGQAIVQTDLTRADIDDIYDHFDQMQAQVRARQADTDELAEAKRTIERLENELRTVRASPANKTTSQPWLENASGRGHHSNENLLTNRGSETGAPAQEILVSERGGLTQRNKLVLSSMNTSGQNQQQNMLNGNNSQSQLGSQMVIREMQERENQLLDQLSMLKDQMRFQTSHSEVNTAGGDPSAFQNEHQQIRIGELETLVFQQREQILQLQDQNGGLKMQLEDKIEENKHKMELYELRNHNLQELNKKYQQEASKTAAVGAGGFVSGQSTQYIQTYATPTMIDGAGIISPDYKSTQVETERMKQYAQQADMKVMDLQHALKEAQVSLKHAQKAKTDTQQRMMRAEQELAKASQDLQLSKVGMNVQDSKLAMLVNELKAKIRKLEAESQKTIQSNSTRDGGNGLNPIVGSSYHFSSNHQIASGPINSTLFALREEYCTKLEKLIEANAQERSELHSQTLALKQKAEGAAAQVKAMEDKEIKLFSQLEEMRAQKSLEEAHLGKALKDQASLLDQKQLLCQDLEREIAQKDKVLAERQGQLSILLGAMESQSQADGVTPLGEAKQKLANMAAELCSLKAVEAQMERRCAEVAHKETQSCGKIQKLEQYLADSESKVAMLSRKVETLESSNELLERQKQDLSNKTQEVDRDKNDFQYKLERLQFQLKTKEETVECLKTQARNAETHFKEQIDRIKEDLLMKSNKLSSYPTLGRNRDVQGQTLSATPAHETIMSCEAQMNEHRPRREVALKIAIQQLHLVIADYIERTRSDANDPSAPTQVEEAQKNIIAEMEKALSVAQTTIQRLEGDLERERHKAYELDNEWDAMALNGILVTRQERMGAQLKATGRLLAEREMQSTDAYRNQLEQFNGVIRSQELKTESDAKVLAQLDQEVQGLKLANKRLLAENEELQASALCYTQEQQAMLVSLEKKAQISVDERQRQRQDALKSFFEQGVAKVLAQAGAGADSDRVQAMGRELAASHILIDKQRRQLEQISAERDGLESTVRFMKATKEDHDAKLRDQVNRAASDQAKLEAFENGSNTNVALSRRKQECLQLEKELIKEREAFELKSREVATLMQRVESYKFDNMQKQLGADLDAIAKRRLEGADDVAQQKIQTLQEQLMEIRGSHIQELEELKVNCDVEVAEARRELSQQQRQFESKFMPGTAPGEILDQNHELRERVSKLQVEVDHLYQESEGLRANLYEREQQIDMLAAELHDRDTAIVDLENTVRQESAVQEQQSTQQQQPLKSALKRNSASQPADSMRNNTHDANSSMPPALIGQLFTAKKAELHAKQKLRIQLQTETKLRQQLTVQLSDALSQQRAAVQHSDDQQTYVVGEDIVNQLMAQNANILAVLQDGGCLSQPAESSQNTLDETDGNPGGARATGDYSVLIKALIYFANLQALKSVQDDLNLQGNAGLLQKAPTQAIIEAQRIVIRALSQRHQADRIKYGPEGEVDRKVWYLELLEEQVGDCEAQTQKLQDFVKRLQIGVSGSLHSAAEIKASSMDLAQHLKLASDEMKTLRNVTGLIKHDVLNLNPENASQPAHTLNNMSMASQQDAFNPFLTGAANGNNLHQLRHVASEAGELQAAHLQMTQKSNMEKILSEHESVQNELNLTSKIKQSLENELVQSKLAHASEMQVAIQKMSGAEKRLHEATQARSQLTSQKRQTEEQLASQGAELDAVKAKLVQTEQSLEEASARAAKATTSSKQWQKVQGDMQEWRRSHEDTLRTKQKQLQESLDKVHKLKADKKKIKAEVQMLRQNQREMRDGSSVDKLKEENQQLVKRFNEQLDERKKEIEFWVQERAQMRDKIDQLESNNNAYGISPGTNMFNLDAAVDGIGSEKEEKLAKKLKSKELELKQLKSDSLEQKNKLAKHELKQVKLEAQVREATTNLSEAQNQVTLLTNRTKELEIEKQMLMASQKEQLRAQDKGTDQVNLELDKMREEFAKIKVQKDELELQTQNGGHRETQWRDRVEKLGREVASLQSNLSLREAEIAEQKSINEKKQAALLSDLKFMRDENQKLHQKLKDANEALMMVEQQVAQAGHQLQAQDAHQDSLRRKLTDQGEADRAKNLQIAQCQAQLQEVETAYYRRIKAMQGSLNDLKAESTQSCQLLQSQIELLKQKLLQERKATSKEIEQSLTITQKESALKATKKELSAAKAQIQTLKNKVKELKQQLDEIPQRPTPQGKGGPPPRRQNLSAAGRPQAPVDEVETALQKKLAEIDGLDKLLNETKKVGELETQIMENQLQISKVENWNYALSQQLDEAKSMLLQAEEKITELAHDKKELAKQRSQAQSQSEKQLKEQIKQLGFELEKMRSDWSSPDQVAAQLEQVVSLQTQVKSLQGEINRKSKTLGHVRQQKEQSTKEQSQVQTEMLQLKEDNTKLKSQLREAQKGEKMSRDLRSQIEWLTKSEKRLKEEMISLNEKLKSTRAELSRKDQHLKDYRDRMDLIQSEVTGKGDLENELTKLKDLNRRQRADLEVKENQVRTLRGRIEQNYAEIQTLADEKTSLTQQDTQLGAKLKTQKQKTRRYENNLQKSVSALKKIGVELAALHQHRQQSSTQSARFGGSPVDQNNPIPVYRRDNGSSSTLGGAAAAKSDNPLAFDDLTKDAAYYKDGVEILGLSMNEMELFINPSAAAAKAHTIADSPARSMLSSSGVKVAITTANAGLVERLERLGDASRSQVDHIDQHEIEEIGDYCVRMLNDIANN